MSGEGPFYHVNKGLVLCVEYHTTIDIDGSHIPVMNIESRQVLTERKMCMLTGKCKFLQGNNFVEIMIPDIGVRWVKLDDFEQRSFPL